MSMTRFYRLSARDPRDARQIGPGPNAFKPCRLQQALHLLVLPGAVLEEKPALRPQVPRGGPGDLANCVQSILARDERFPRLEPERLQVRIAEGHVRRVGHDEIEALFGEGLEPLPLSKPDLQSQACRVKAGDAKPFATLVHGA